MCVDRMSLNPKTIFSSLSLAARQDARKHLFAAPLILTRYSWHERRSFFSRALKPGRREWLASVRRLWRDFFFAHRENIGPLIKFHSPGAADIWSPFFMDLHDRDHIASLRRLWRDFFHPSGEQGSVTYASSTRGL